MRQMLTQAQTAGQYFTNDQIKEMTRKVSAEVDLVHQQTQNQRYGSSHIGATAKDISNVVTRSEERRVGKECRCRWAPDHQKKTIIKKPAQSLETETPHRPTCLTH